MNFSVSAARTSGSHAIGLGYMFIRNGLQDAVICGGAQEVKAINMRDGQLRRTTAGYFREAKMSIPEKASRPLRLGGGP